ncbi:MAG: TonB family protein [Sphingobacteriaceae bacterium]|nr:TonB family protein [Sphingobacteriaceae bacterium]
MAIHLAFIFHLLASVFLNDSPEFKGGARGLNSFITRNLIYPEYSKQNCVQGTIQISFRLDRKGGIIESRVQKGFGIDLDDEALRIIRLTSGHWKVPQSFDTTQSIVIPINFSLKEYNCAERSQEDIRTSIAAYKAHEDLSKAVINFYEKKNNGSYSAADEMKILELKQQLGYDERFFDRLLRQGQQKLKQGDKYGACEDFNLIRKLGSEKSRKQLAENCR